MRRKTRGFEVIRWIEDHCVHTQGRWIGKPFKLMSWQKALILALFEINQETGLRRFGWALWGVPKKNGKALALDTPIPTPGGWSTMGELREGDEIFDENGKPCRVTFATEVMHGHTCYRVHFSDGTSIVADAEHLWRTRTLKPENTEREWTTDEIRRTLRRGDGAANHSIDVAGGLETPAADLPIDPYTLGAWLGDGSTANGQLHNPDPEVWNRIADAGYEFGRDQADPISRTILGLQVELRACGVLGNKHVPAVYLRASKAQRMELLRGLLDTDGTTSAAGQVTFTTTRPELRDGFLELARSLGFKPTSREYRAMLDGKDCGPAWDIQIWPFDDTHVFYIARKRDRQKPRPPRRARSESRQIVDVEPVESVPVRCIQVDSQSHLYLAGEAMVPTHNTELAGALALYFLIGDGEPSPLVACAAASDGQADLVFGAAKTMCEMSPTLSPITERFDKEILASQAIIWNKHTQSYDMAPNPGAKIRRVAAAVGTNDGPSYSAVILDELHQWKSQKGRDVWTVLTNAGGAREQPMVLQITTAGYDEETVCYEQYAYCKKIESGEVKDDTYHFFWIEPADEDCDYKDEKVWAAVNPSLGVTVSIEFLRSQLLKKPENTFRRFFLNQWTSADDSWLPSGVWAAGLDKRATIPNGADVWLGVDVASRQDHAAVVVVHVRDDDIVVRAKVFKPKTGTRNEVSTIDISQIENAIVAYSKKYRVRGVAFDPMNFERSAQELSEKGLLMIDFFQRAKRQERASERLYEAVVNGKIKHNGNPELTRHVGNGVEKKTPEGWKLSRGRAKKKIDALMAMMFAVDTATDNEGSSVYEDRGLATV